MSKYLAYLGYGLADREEVDMVKEQVTLRLIMVLAFALGVLIVFTVEAQEILILKDGTKLTGRMEKEQEGKITFRTEGGIVMELSSSDVKEVIRPSKDDARSYLYNDPNNTRLFWAPTGRTLEAGKGYFADYYVFFPTIAYGITNRFTIYGAMSIIPFIGLNEQLFFVSPKLGIVQRENFAISTGAMVIAIPDVEEIPGIIYGVSTWGNKNNSLIAGLGWGGLFGEEDELMDGPIIMIGGEHRISKNMKFITENWLVTGADLEENPVLSIGIRFFGEKLAADLGFFHIVGADLGGFPFIPWVGFVYNF
jgi:hypothetical protein